MVRKEGKYIVFEIAHIASDAPDEIIMDEDGLRTLAFLVSKGNKAHRDFLKRDVGVKKIEQLGPYPRILLRENTIVQKLIQSADHLTIRISPEKLERLRKQKIFKIKACV